LFLIVPHATPAWAQQDSACITCHEFLGGSLAQPVVLWKDSVHRQNGIACEYCHGGNADVDLGDMSKLSSTKFADAKARTMSTSEGFVGVPSGKALFEMCRQCHGASVERYGSSIMGKAYLNDNGGPSCVLCHGAHRNAMPEVPKACEGCHTDTSGFEQIDPMNVTGATIAELSSMRVKMAQEKATGSQPPLFPALTEELDSYQIGLVAFGAVLALLLIGYILYVVLERSK